MSYQFRYWDPGKNMKKKKVSLARLIPFIKMRFMQGSVCAVLSLLHALVSDSCLRLYQMVEEQVCV